MPTSNYWPSAPTAVVAQLTEFSNLLSRSSPSCARGGTLVLLLALPLPPVSISQAFHDKYVKNATPPTWKEHLKTLRQKEHDPPPKKGVAARMRSAPTGKALRGSKQEPMPQPASAKNARAARLAKRSGRAPRAARAAE